MALFLIRSSSKTRLLSTYVQHIADYAFGLTTTGMRRAAMRGRKHQHGWWLDSTSCNLCLRLLRLFRLVRQWPNRSGVPQWSDYVHVSSDCDDQQVFDLLTINVSFDPVCSPITLTTPSQLVCEYDRQSLRTRYHRAASRASLISTWKASIRAFRTSARILFRRAVATTTPLRFSTCVQRA